MQAALFTMIGIGGALGALTRYGITWVFAELLGRDFPYGTLAVNAVGCLLAGVLFVFLFERLTLPAQWHALLIVGFLGAMTTFSSFALESLQLIQTGKLLLASINIIANMFTCLLLTWLGIQLGRMI